MRIVSWNCCMAWHRKQHLIEIVRPDIAVIQEISLKDIESTNAPFIHWVGNSRHKGLGIIGYANRRYTMSDSYTVDIPWFVPFTVDDLHLLAIWACVASNARRYVRLIHEAIDHYDAFLAAPQVIALGDYNSNANFDRKHQRLSHSLMVQRLAEKGLTSVYHQQTGEEHGSETSPTFFLHRSPAKPYHFDFAFVSESLMPQTRLAIGTQDRFVPASDHLPLILDITTNRPVEKSTGR
jgi:exonuclease III